jgi:hypothetical protein
MIIPNWTIKYSQYEIQITELAKRELNKKKQRSTHHKEGNDSVNRNEGRRGRLQKKSDGSESESGEGIYFTGNLENREI